MFFYFSKLVWLVGQPRHWLALIFFIGLIALWRGRWLLGLGLFFVGPCLYVAAGTLPIGNFMLMSLEHRHPRNSAYAQGALAGIIVPGGGVPPAESVARGEVALTEAGERLAEAVRLAREHPEAKIVFSGGEAMWPPTGETEAKSAKQYFTDMGVDPSRFILEDRARNTYENAKFTAQLALPEPGRRWLLVTTAYHMPRALGCFRAAGFDIEPWPVGFWTPDGKNTSQMSVGPAEMRRRLSVAIKEWAGLVVYRLMGRIDRLLP